MRYAPRKRPTDESELKAELVRNAAFVAYEGLKAKALATWLSQGEDRRVILLFDTDIIVAHCAPWLKGPVDDASPGQGYGQVLPLQPIRSESENDQAAARSEERRRAEAVCWLLADKALQNALSRGIPILQAKSHLEETLRVYGAVKTNAAADGSVTRTSSQERQNHSTDQMLQTISRVVAHDRSQLGGNPGRFLSSILSRMQNENLQQASRYVREWDSFLDLFRRSGGIFDLTEFRPGEDFLKPELHKKWLEVCSIVVASAPAQTERPDKLRDIFASIVAPSHFQFRRDQLTDDVDALEIVARASAAAECGGLDSLRVVLVTGDKKIVLALAASEEKLPCFGDKTSRSGQQTVSEFTFAHVHHLWSFVDGFALDKDSPAIAASPSGLFSGLLAFEEETRSERTRYSARLIQNSIRADPQLVKHLNIADIDQSYRRWFEYAESAANLHRHFLVDQVKLDKISDILINKFEQHGLSLTTERTRAMVVETISRARDRTNVQFSKIGANSILDAHRHGVRNPPDLMFDSLKITTKIFNDLALPRRVFMSAEDFAVRFEQISQDCYQPREESSTDDDYRQECYVKYLVLGALFSSANRWIVAEQHAESAVNIIKRAEALDDPVRTRALNGRSAPVMSGREAYFLLAVARRIRARDQAGYALAERALGQAVECLATDKGAGTAAGISSVRFDCEYLALALGRYYLVRSNDSSQPCHEEADQIFQRARGIRQTMSSQIEVHSKQWVGLPASTRSTIATNLVQTAVIARFRELHNFVGDEVSPVSAEDLYRALSILMQDTDFDVMVMKYLGRIPDASSSETAEIICSPLMMLYGVVGILILGDPRIPFVFNARDLDVLFNLPNTILTFYDVWRFDMLKRFAKQLLPAD